MDDKQVSRKATTILKRAGVTLFGGAYWSTRVMGNNIYIFAGLNVSWSHKSGVMLGIERQGYTVDVNDRGTMFLSREQLEENA